MASNKSALLKTTRLASVLLGFVVTASTHRALAAQTDIHGPAGSAAFGTSVAVLPNGNIVVADPEWSDDVGVERKGAVYLYTSGGQLISTLTGSSADDNVGSQIVVLSNGNFVVGSSDWSNGAKPAVGAVTWVNGSNGLSGVVSGQNSLIGSADYDEIGEEEGVVALSDGNYLVLSQYWSNAAVAYAGAVTWADGSEGLSGQISATNSLVGTTTNDQVGSGNSIGPRVTLLTNGNAVVTSSSWSNGKGAATLINAGTGLHGAVSNSNSLVGSSAGDQVGGGGVTALTNGKYVVMSPSWNNASASHAGAATWGNGASGIVGAVSTANSLVGTMSNDYVGSAPNFLPGVTALTNGNYVVLSSIWHGNLGAATWANGSSGLVGIVSASNSLVGAVAGDNVSYGGVFALANGHYVVSSYHWNNGATTDVGAVTWANGTTGLAGTVTTSNSLTGSTMGDEIGYYVAALSSGNYVVGSPDWSHGATLQVGAATWMNGSAKFSGAVSTSNSLTGSVDYDHVSNRGVFALSNGNYVVDSNVWNNGAATAVGAVTWGNGATGLVGSVSTANSLIGSTMGDNVGENGIFPLPNGNYVVSSTNWNASATTTLVGAVTWVNGTHAFSGAVSANNSLVGGTQGDSVGFDRVLPQSNSNYLVASFEWNNGDIAYAGAVSDGRANGGTVGLLSSANSVLGTAPSGGTYMSETYDAAHDIMFVGQPISDVVSMFSSDLIFKNGFQ